MADQQELIRRLLDGELDPASQEQLRRMAEQDPRLAATLQQARTLHDDLGQLGQVSDPGPGLTDRIMQALPVRPDAPPRWLRWLQRPLPVPAWAMALVLVALGLLLVRQALRPAPRPSAAVVEQRQPAPACPQQVLVRFVLKAPGARQVSLAGDFNQWSVEATPLADPDEDGIWSVMLPLRPGRYQYKFIVDGERWIIDPNAPAYHPDGFGGRNALLAI